jgi:hypothetical protein
MRLPHGALIIPSVSKGGCLSGDPKCTDTASLFVTLHALDAMESPSCRTQTKEKETEDDERGQNAMNPESVRFETRYCYPGGGRNTRIKTAPAPKAFLYETPLVRATVSLLDRLATDSDSLLPLSRYNAFAAFGFRPVTARLTGTPVTTRRLSSVVLLTLLISNEIPRCPNSCDRSCEVVHLLASIGKISERFRFRSLNSRPHIIISSWT